MSEKCRNSHQNIVASKVLAQSAGVQASLNPSQDTMAKEPMLGTG